MLIDKSKLDRIFEKQREFHARDGKGLVKDRIFRGMFESTLMKQGYDKGALMQACEEGLMKRTYIDPDGRGIRTAYLWLKEEMPQRGFFKQMLDRITKWWGGDYERYYG